MGHLQGFILRQEILRDKAEDRSWVRRGVPNGSQQV